MLLTIGQSYRVGAVAGGGDAFALAPDALQVASGVTFEGVALGATLAGGGLTFPRFANGGFGGNVGLAEVAVSPPTSTVPEPATVALVGAGLAAVAGVVRRRRVGA